MITRFSRGMLYLMTFPDKGRRPGIIVSNNLGNTFSTQVIAVPCTNNTDKKDLPTHLTLKMGENTESVALCENLTSINKTSCTTFIGVLDEITLKKLDNCIKMALGLVDIPQKEQQPRVISAIDNAPQQTFLPRQKLIRPGAKRTFLQELEDMGKEFVMKKYHINNEGALANRVHRYRTSLNIK